MSFSPTIDQITDPEPGSFQHKAHVGIDEKGNIVAEGEVDRKWTDFSSGPARPKVSLALLKLFEGWIKVDPSVRHPQPQRSSTVLGSKKLKRYLHD